MNPEKEIESGNRVYYADKAYYANVDSPTTKWKPLGWATGIIPSERDYDFDLEDIKTVKPLKVTTVFKMKTLPYRAFRSMCGMSNPSLIHNGKKRRK